MLRREAERVRPAGGGSRTARARRRLWPPLRRWGALAGWLAGCSSYSHRVAYMNSSSPSTRVLNLTHMRSAALIREARLRAGLTQADLAERTGRDRSVIARWEQAVVSPSVETLTELVRACGFDLPLELEPLDTSPDDRLRKNTMLSPERRVRRLLGAVEREGEPGG